MIEKLSGLPMRKPGWERA